MRAPIEVTCVTSGYGLGRARVWWSVATLLGYSEIPLLIWSRRCCEWVFMSEEWVFVSKQWVFRLDKAGARTQCREGCYNLDRARAIHLNQSF